MDFSYEQIQKYVVDYQVEGNKVFVEFENEHGEIHEASSTLRKEKNLKNDLMKNVGRIAKSQARRHASRIVRSALGSNMLGRIGREFVNTSSRYAQTPGENTFSESEIQQGIAQAFKRVQRNFEINKGPDRKLSERDRRVSSRREEVVERRIEKSRIEEFDYQNQLKRFPLKNVFEQDVLSKILVGIAYADGNISEEEKSFIQSVIPKKLGSIEEIISRGEVSSVEANELSMDIKKSILLLAWTVALVDFDLASSENRRLNEYGALLGFEFQECEEVAQAAKYEILTTVMDPYMNKKNLYQYTDGINLTRDQAEVMFIKFKKSVSY